ncbi:MAG: hypothetical protein AMXMBFR82_17070 [Candidatus Hydrogenedentota bacterium]
MTTQAESRGNHDTVFKRLVLTILGWIGLVIACNLIGGEWVGFLLSLLVTFIAAILFIGFLIEGLVRMALYHRDRYMLHQDPSKDPSQPT